MAGRACRVHPSAREHLRLLVCAAELGPHRLCTRRHEKLWGARDADGPQMSGAGPPAQAGASDDQWWAGAAAPNVWRLERQGQPKTCVRRVGGGGDTMAKVQGRRHKSHMATFATSGRKLNNGETAAPTSSKPGRSGRCCPPWCAAWTSFLAATGAWPLSQEGSPAALSLPFDLNRRLGCARTACRAVSSAVQAKRVGPREAGLADQGKHTPADLATQPRAVT